MQETKTFHQCPMGRLVNDAFGNVVTEFSNRIHQFELDPSYLLLKQVTIDALTEKKALLIEITKQASAQFETKEITELDGNRDRGLRYIIGSIATKLLSYLDDERTAAEQLEVVLRPYKGIDSLPYERESQAIDGLLHDLQKVENEEALVKLGLTPAVAQLTTDNNAFRRLYASRSDKKQDKKLPSAKTVRNEAMDLLDTVRKSIEVAYYYTDDEEKKAAIGSLIDHLNGVLDAATASYNKSHAKKSDDTDTPTEAAE